MTKLEKYVSQHLTLEKRVIETSHRNNELTLLNSSEKAIIYKYTEDGYDPLNIDLRRNSGKHNTEYGKFLEKSINKLPNYIDVVYRSCNLSPNQIDLYQNSFIRKQPITENCFLSTSKKRTIAMMFGGNCLFIIFSRTGKDIEKIAKFGTGSGQNEYEVLFLPKRKFNVIDINIENNSYTITLEEIS
ncbi:MAG: hypothetical protein HY062_00090 [Bacteroidetes bacterium]|nr:hypothetical protein [Bacteroidota bacterium]